jgi:hypothetical protein
VFRIFAHLYSSFVISHPMSLLAQFLLRLAFGLAVGIAITSPRQVSSGFYRNHLYVTLGLATLAALALSSLSSTATWLAAAAAVLSFVGAAAWLYESRRVGLSLLWLVAATSLGAALVGASGHGDTSAGVVGVLWWLSIPVSGLSLGLTTASMLLGHWYLNSPGMELAPLRKLLVAAAAAIAAQAVISAWGLAAQWESQDAVPFHWVLLRWSFGIVGVAAMLWMAWQTLKIPNTQSATGILYVAVIGAFIGELAAGLLSAESAYPL